MAFLISTFQLFYFPSYQGVPNLHQGALRPLDAPQRRNFFTRSEYFTMSNCVFNFNILALVLFGILGGSQIYIRGPCAPRRPPSVKIFETRTSACLYLYNCKFSASQLHSRGTNEALSLHLVCIDKFAKMEFLKDFGGRGQDIWWNPPQECNDRRSTSFGEKIMEMLQIAQSVHSAKKLQK